MGDNMEERLSAMLEEIGIPAYYITRKNSQKFPCIVYQFIETTEKSSDDEEELIKYEVFFNIYAGDDIVDIKRSLMTLLKKNNFKKKLVPITVYHDDLECFEQALQYSIVVDYNCQ